MTELLLMIAILGKRVSASWVGIAVGAIQLKAPQAEYRKDELSLTLVGTLVGAITGPSFEMDFVDLRFHDLRPTNASTLLNVGGSLKEV